MYKVYLAVVLAVLLAFWQLPGADALSAQGSVLIDAHSGRVLLSSNAHTRMGMASTTKIMTALLALEEGRPDDIVTVSPAAASVEGSSIYLKSGEKIRLEDLVYGLMLHSGNDAATAIAEHIGGDPAAFAEKMNRRAREMGLENTSFSNPHGLSDDNHYTTAYDLAQITRFALANPVFSQIVSTRVKTIGQDGETIRTLSNHNKLLTMYEGADGVKTGFTKKTGRCLVSSATRGALKLIAVTLNAPDDWRDHAEMLNHGFAKYRLSVPVRQGAYMRSIPLLGSSADRISVHAAKSAELAVNDSDEIRVEYDLPNYIAAPVSQGTVQGEVHVYLSGERMQTVPLVVSEDAPAVGRIRFAKAFSYLLQELFRLF